MSYNKDMKKVDKKLMKSFYQREVKTQDKFEIPYSVAIGLLIIIGLWMIF